MTVFSDEQMFRPIFEHLGDVDIAAPDGCFRFGEGFPRRANRLGQEYYNAAYTLGEIALHQPENQVGEIASPVVFLYRHSVELFLKAIIPPDRQQHHHDLERLAHTFSDLVAKEYLADVPDWIIERLNEIAQADPRSTAFRYCNGGGVPDGGPVQIDVAHLQSSMKALNTALVGVLASLAIGEGRDGPREDLT